MGVRVEPENEVTPVSVIVITPEMFRAVQNPEVSAISTCPEAPALIDLSGSISRLLKMSRIASKSARIAAIERLSEPEGLLGIEAG